MQQASAESKILLRQVVQVLTKSGALITTLVLFCVSLVIYQELFWECVMQTLLMTLRSEVLIQNLEFFLCHQILKNKVVLNR